MFFNTLFFFLQIVWNLQVNIKVLDVDEPPVFSLPIYTFTVMEEQLVKDIGKVTARDPDKANKSIRYSTAQSSHTNKVFLIVHGDRYTKFLRSLFTVGTLY